MGTSRFLAQLRLKGQSRPETWSVRDDADGGTPFFDGPTVWETDEAFGRGVTTRLSPSATSSEIRRLLAHTI